MYVRVLGPLEVTQNDERLALGGPKQRLVLAHLVIRANQVVSSDRLIDEIWGDEPPDAARSSLQSYVSHLRSALGAQRLEGRPPGYILHLTDQEIDAGRFEARTRQARGQLSGDPASAARTLRDALGLWRGDAFADLADAFSLQPEIERLNELRLGAQEDLVEAELSLGRSAELVPELERLVAGNLLRERLAGQLMLALYRSGRQADALAVYHRLRTALSEELGLDPSAALETLQLQILNHDAALDMRGEPLRGYRVLERIGEGPLGAVSRALDPHSQREVAIKVIGKPVANDRNFVRNFEAAATRIARFENPHVVALLDYWREPDAAYLVMRLMTGGSLTEHMTGNGLTTERAVRWVEQLGSALSAAHRQHIVHGDVRPGNVLLDTDGNAYLSDFWLGLDLAGGNGNHGPAKGDGYLAAERLNGAPPSPAADIFAFGRLIGAVLQAAGDNALLQRVAPTLARSAATAETDRPRDALDLVEAVRQGTLNTPAAEPVLAIAGSPLRNPYKGLRAFEEADASDFVGREELVAQLAERMTEWRGKSQLLAVVGPSGSGKSSVVSAGLVPALRAGAIAGSEQWFVAGMTPGLRPFEQLERALLSVAVNAPASLAELLHDEQGLSAALDRVLPEGAQLLLLVDQFEELFTLSDSSRTRFLDTLGRTLEDGRSRMWLVITLRADFYDRPLRHELFGRHLAGRTHAVPAMTSDELARAITEPARRNGLSLEPGLVARIVADMSDQPGALPLLQYALSELWERKDGGLLSLRGYTASGGIAGAVSRRAEALVTQLDDDGREAARQLFLRLVEPGEGAADTARRIRRAELDGLGVDAGLMNEVTESFARYRLLLLDRDAQTREPTVELAHEALLSAWPRLQQWVDDAREDLRHQRRLVAASKQWVEGGRDPSFLLTGGRLEQTAAWAAETPILLDAQSTEFVTASVAEQRRQHEEEERRAAREASLERRALTRLRALVVVLGLGALLAGVLSVFALREGDRAEREGRTAKARELAAAAVANLKVDAERSILLALQAIDVTRSVDGTVIPEAEEALHQSVVASRVVRTVPGEGGEVATARMKDGTAIFVTQGPEESGNITIRELVGGSAVRSWHGHDADINDVALSADATRVATTGDDGLLRVWDIATTSKIAEVAGTGQVWGPSFSPDGNTVAAAWLDEGVVRVVDVASGNVREVRAIPRYTQATAFSPDGRELVIGPVYYENEEFPDGANGLAVLDAASLAEVRTLVADNVGVALFGFEIAYSPDGRLIACGSVDATAKVWDSATGRLLYSIEGHAAEVLSVDWSDLHDDDSNYLFTGSRDGTTLVWKIGDHGYVQVRSFASQDLQGGIAGVAVEPGGTRVVVGGNVVQAVKIWDAGISGDEEQVNMPGDPAGVNPLAFVEDSVLAVSTGDGGVDVWDVSSGATKLGHLPPDDSGNTVSALEESPDLRTTAILRFGVALLVDSQTGDTIHPFEDPLFRVGFSNDGKQLAAVSEGSATVQVFDATGSLLRTSEGTPGFVAMDVDVRDDGLVAAAEVPQGRPDLAANQVALHDPTSPDQTRLLPAAGASGPLMFNPAGDRFALAFFDGHVEIWKVDDGSKVVLAGHIGEIRDLAFSADGSTLATAGDDGTVRLWDAATGAPTLVLRGHEARVDSVAFSPDGAMLASAGGDGITRVWALRLDDLIEIALRNVTRQLTEAECRQYLHLEACPTASP